jgi:hypothetical protein
MRYDYKCVECDRVTVHESKFEAREDDRACECGAKAEYQFPLGAILGFRPFESYYDEALDCDIHGVMHKKRVMRQAGVIEAGDKVGGARNFDSKAPNPMKPLPPRGVEYTPKIRKPQDFDMEVQDKDGSWRKAKTQNV